MKNVTDLYDPLGVPDAIEDAPVADPNAQPTLLILQLLAPRRPRIFGENKKTRRDPFLNFPPELPELPVGRRGELDPEGHP